MPTSTSRPPEVAVARRVGRIALGALALKAAYPLSPITCVLLAVVLVVDVGFLMPELKAVWDDVSILL